MSHASSRSRLNAIVRPSGLAAGASAVPSRLTHAHDAAVGRDDREAAVGTGDRELVVGDPAVPAASVRARGRDREVGRHHAAAVVAGDRGDDDVGAPVPRVEPRQRATARRPPRLAHAVRPGDHRRGLIGFAPAMPATLRASLRGPTLAKCCAIPCPSRELTGQRTSRPVHEDDRFAPTCPKG